MLLRMHIRNFALIDEAVFEPGLGFSGITGETGAGKSLLIDSISALCGQRVGRDLVRTGESRATVEAVFDRVSVTVPDAELTEKGIVPEPDDTIILSREILSDGKSTARINGRLVPVSLLRDIGQRLIDIHGQNDQQSIFLHASHLHLLDRYSGRPVQEAIAAYSEILLRYRQCIDEIKSLGTDPEQQSKRAEILSFQIHELENADFKAGEEEELTQKMRLLSSSEKIKENLNALQLAMDQSDDSVISQLYVCDNLLSQAVVIDPSLAPQQEYLRSAAAVLSGLSADIDQYLRQKDEPRESVDVIEKRLDVLFRFKVKYGKTVPEMHRFLENARTEYQQIIGSEKRLSQLHKDRLLIEKELMQSADRIHTLRLSAAGRLSTEIMHELEDLGMAGSVFRVAFSQRPRDRFFSRSGYDDLEFLMSANTGEPEKPLSKVASGGEASRIMLAIKTILASADDTPILIFDEIDAGISGATATSVAQKLSRLSKTHQVLCVTHMAQIAAATDNHFLIEKITVNGRTCTSIQQLGPEERKREIARLLSGEKEDDASLDLAGKMIRKGKRDETTSSFQ